MSLGWKDAGSTLLVGGVMALAVAVIREWASFLTIRWSLVGMLILGIGACAVGAYSPTHAPALYTITMGILVAASVTTVLLGLIFGNKVYVVMLAIIIGILWLSSTVRHALV